jgi:hypothetical protein
VLSKKERKMNQKTDQMISETLDFCYKKLISEHSSPHLTGVVRIFRLLEVARMMPEKKPDIIELIFNLESSKVTCQHLREIARMAEDEKTEERAIKKIFEKIRTEKNEANTFDQIKIILALKKELEDKKS